MCNGIERICAYIITVCITITFNIFQKKVWQIKIIHFLGFRVRGVSINAHERMICKNTCLH
jgi:hypothetical protein